MKFEDFKVGMILLHKAGDPKQKYKVLGIDYISRKILISYVSKYTYEYVETWEPSDCLAPYYEEEILMPKFKVGDIINHKNKSTEKTDYEIRAIVDDHYVVRWNNIVNNSFFYVIIDEFVATEYYFLKPVKVEVGQKWYHKTMPNLEATIHTVTNIYGVEYAVYVFKDNSFQFTQTETLLKYYTLDK